MASRIAVPLSAGHPKKRPLQMSRLNGTAVLFAVYAITVSSARANDSRVEVSLGGLTFTKSDSISMDSEDLFISRNRVRVKYRFTNTSDSPIDTLVAFPLPDIPPYSNDDDRSFWGNPSSRLKFKTTVDGKPLALTLVEQAIFQGQDISSRLTGLHIPLNRFADGLWAAVNRLPKIDRERLIADGLISDSYGGEDDSLGLWTLKTTVTRHQAFPAHKTVTVEHEYAPMTGGSVAGWLNPEYRTSPDLAAGVKEERRRYCIDDDWLLSFDKNLRSRDNKEISPGYGEIWIGYVLKTGANWKGPIGDFRLVVDKGKPDSMVSFCADGVKKISSTQFEVHRTNFTPSSDLDILIIDWFNH